MEYLLVPDQASHDIVATCVLVIAPQADYEVFGCGGAIIRHVERQTPVQVVIVTDGAYGLEDDERVAMTLLRQNESLAAAQHLGYGKPQFWNLPERTVVYGERLVIQLIEAIADADLVYAPSIYETHPDHRALGMAVVEAVRRVGNPVRLALYEVGVPIRPNTLLDISDIAERKMSAMACFVSQTARQRCDLDIAALNRYRSYTLPPEVTAVEAYIVLKAEELSRDPLRIYQSEYQRHKEIGLLLDGRDAPLVSVIVRSMDRPTLSEALDSVALQTYCNIEVVVVNAKGSDHKELDAWCGRFPLRLFGTGAHLPRSRAANLGLDAAHGDYLLFLDDDDWFMPEHINVLVNALESRRDIAVAYSGVICVDENKNPLPDRFAKPYDALQLLSTNYIPIHSALFSKILLEKGCRIDESLDLYEDWDFWIQASKISDFLFVNRFSSIYRISSQSGFGVNFDQNKANQASLIIYEKWFPNLKGGQLLDIAHLVRSYDANQQSIKDLYDTIGKRDTWISERDAKIVELYDLIKEQGEKVNVLNRAIDEQKRLVRERDNMLAETENKLQQLQLNFDTVVKEPNFADIRTILTNTQNELSQVYNSRSWKITRPFRAIRRKIYNYQNFIYQIVRKLWQISPLSIRQKVALKRLVLKFFPVLTKYVANDRPAVKSDSMSTYDSQAEASQLQTSDYHNFYQYYINNAKSCLTRDYVPISTDKTDLTRSDIRLIAFYLPQFHPIPENDREWGKGFTEWTNVSKAVPQFIGHYQPRLPGELGFYDLRLKEIQRRQIELAQQYGIYGFCYHHYWFDGKKVLDQPFQQILADPSLDLPFCLCWANENWTRRWDGSDDEIILAQHYSPKDDLALIRDLEPAFRDSRYIRIDGKPLLVVYRPELLPDPKQTAQRWRDYTVAAGIGDLFLVAAATFGFENYRSIGYDGLVQFPPHAIGTRAVSAREITHDIPWLNPSYQGHIFDYADYASQAIQSLKDKEHIFPCVMMDWDNEARKPGRGHTYHGCSPQRYKHWLASAFAMASNNRAEERLVFINAWNEWAEGTYLEPDRRYGYAYLHATREVLKARINARSGRKIVLVSHDGHPHGAQYLVLHLARVLTDDFGFDVAVIVLDDGVLLPEYARIATLHDLSGVTGDSKTAQSLAQKLAYQGYKSAIVNTTVSGLFLETLADAGLHCVALIHELSGIIATYRLQAHARAIARKAAAVVFPADIVADQFPEKPAISQERLHIRPQGLYKKNAFKRQTTKARLLLRNNLNIKDNSKVVLGVGYADYRKGIDLFVDIGLALSAKRKDVYFVWLGHWDDAMYLQVQQRLSDEAHANRLLFPGRRDDTDFFYAGADLFALTSREDPFPSVTLESLDVAVPVIGFKDTGGSEIILKQGCGVLVEKENCDAFANAIDDLLNDPAKIKALGQKGAQLIESTFSFRHYIYDLLSFAGLPLKRVSAIVPNYNYAGYLTQRLHSIIGQSYPIFELIVLDDASTDNSLEIAENCLADSKIDYRIIKNERNSGSVFKQWRKAVELARGDLIWIAEADDDASAVFLEKSLPFFDDEQMVMTYTQSSQVNGNNALLNDHYLDYTNDIDPHKWLDDYTNDGLSELASVLAVKNTIPNVSAVVFRKVVLESAFARCESLLPGLNIAGDWLIYTEVLQQGKLAFIAESLNVHRRHERSVTASSSSCARHLAEILFMQQKVVGLVDIDDSVKTKAARYVQTIYRQFNLDKDGTTDPEQHELICAALATISRPE